MSRRTSKILALLFAAVCGCSGGSGGRKAGSEPDGGSDVGGDAGGEVLRHMPDLLTAMRRWDLSESR